MLETSSHLYFLSKGFAFKAALYEDFPDCSAVTISPDSRPPESSQFDVLVIVCSNSFGIINNPDILHLVGPNFMSVLSNQIHERFLGEQPVGNSFLLPGGKNFSYVCWTCISRIDSVVPADFGYLALWSAFCAIHAFNLQKKEAQDKTRLKTVVVPDLSEFIKGEVDQELLKDLVRQMGLATRAWFLSEFHSVRTPEDSVNRHRLITEKKVATKKETQAMLQGFLYQLSGDIQTRGLCNISELEILMEWITEECKHTKVATNALCNLLNRPDSEFALTQEIITERVLSSTLCLSTLLDMASRGEIKLHREIPRSSIVTRKKSAILGQGTIGTVQVGTWSDMKVAVKTFEDKDTAAKEFGREVGLLSLIKHNNIVRCFGASTNKADLFLVEELMVGSLWDLLHDSRIVITETHQLDFASGTANGMKYLHQCRLVHRDLKSLNVLVGSNFEIKICDFGLSRFYEKDTTMTNNIGTVCWIAPEIFAKKPYNEKVDVYSFAIVFWEILTREEPFSEMSNWSVPLAVIRGDRPPIPKDTHRSWARLISKSWSKRPAERPSFHEIVAILKKFKLDYLASHAHLRLSTKKLSLSREGKRFKVHVSDEQPGDQVFGSSSDSLTDRSHLTSPTGSGFLGGISESESVLELSLSLSTSIGGNPGSGGSGKHVSSSSAESSRSRHILTRSNPEGKRLSAPGGSDRIEGSHKSESDSKIRTLSKARQSSKKKREPQSTQPLT